MLSKRILWIENQLEYNGPHLSALRTAGFVVDTALSAKEGIEILRSGKENYSLILLDILMGDALLEGRDVINGRTGLVVYDLIRDELKLQTPIVFVTVISDLALNIVKKIRQKENLLGNKFLILHKPVRPSELLQTVRSVVGYV